VRPTRSPFFWQDSDSDSGILNKLGLPLWPCAKIHTPGTLTQHPWGTGALKVEKLALKIAVFGICSGTPPLLLSFFFSPFPSPFVTPFLCSSFSCFFPTSSSPKSPPPPLVQYYPKPHFIHCSRILCNVTLFIPYSMYFAYGL